MSCYCLAYCLRFKPLILLYILLVVDNKDNKIAYLLYKKKHAVEKNRKKPFLLSTLSTGREKVIEQTRLMDGEGDGIMGIGRKGRERRKGYGERTGQEDGHLGDG